jgi:hypothetical protein
MYYKPPMHPEFRNGYRLGVEKGRRIERKVCFSILVAWMFVWFILNSILSHFSKCS